MIDKYIKWVCAAACFATWLAILSGGFRLAFMLPALLVAGAYVGGYWYEMSARGHIGLSADPSALGAAAAAAVIGTIIAYVAKVPLADIVQFLAKIPGAWLGGHAVVFAIFLVGDKLGWDKAGRQDP